MITIDTLLNRVYSFARMRKEKAVLRKMVKSLREESRKNRG